MDEVQLAELRELQREITKINNDIIDLNKKFVEVAVRMHELVQSVEEGLS